VRAIKLVKAVLGRPQLIFCQHQIGLLSLLFGVRTRRIQINCICLHCSHPANTSSLQKPRACLLAGCNRAGLPFMPPFLSNEGIVGGNLLAPSHFQATGSSGDADTDDQHYESPENLSALLFFRKLVSRERFEKWQYRR